MSLRSEVIRILNELLSNSKKISELPAASTLTGTEQVELNQGGTSVRTTTQDIANLGGGGGGAVSSVFGRTGAVTAQTGDYSVAMVTGAAPILSPVFTGLPEAPTAAPGTNTTQLATTAFVTAAVGGGGAVSSVFTRTGAVTAQNGDYTASQITNVPAGTISAITVQAAIDELDSSTANPMTTQGDIIVGGASGSLARMGIGSPYNLMRVNSGATSPQYFGLTTGSVAFWSATGLTEDNANYFWDDTNNRLGTGTNAPSSRLEVRTDALGITQVTTSGLALVNTTAAANLAAQISPSLRFTSNGWGTTAGTSQEVTTEIYSLSVQSTVPTGSLVFRRRIAGAAAVEYGTISTAGLVAFPNFNASSGVATNDWNRLNQAVMNISPSNGHSGTGIRFQYVSNGSNTQTSGNQIYADFAATFLPTSGTATWSPINITGQVSQTGGANGAVTFVKITAQITAGGNVDGFVYDPAVTSIAGTHNAFKSTSGGFSLPTTVTTAGTTGNQTINKMTGTVNFAAAATALTVTNSLVTANSLVFCEVRTNDATAIIKNVVPGSGSFVITLNAAATAETSVGFIVFN